MIASLAALQLVLLSQTPPPPKEAPPEPPAQPAAPAEAAPRRENPPLPKKAEKPRAAVAPGRPRQLSLLSGESLGGGSASLGWAGWSSFGIMYGQGVTADDDLAALGDFDWAKTELRLGGLYRHALGKAGDLDVAGRFSAAWYRDMGATYVDDKNHADLGLELTPGVSASMRTSGGVFSGMVEAPLTITFKYGKGLLFAPRLSVAYEAFLYTDFTVGARLGLGYRAGSGDAPLKDGHAELLFVLMAGYQLL
ncbi:MAG TPA: hypothetical protein VIV57_01230 [Anaeromyxobacter sp.]